MNITLTYMIWKDTSIKGVNPAGMSSEPRLGLKGRKPRNPDHNVG